ncbi:hypothetical protein B0H13DRAFT_1895004 [Mycena leptocephala]|nr:hypothetical protein B0H13DRAFT_1895004 [Mycena leptocephala]
MSNRYPKALGQFVDQRGNKAMNWCNASTWRLHGYGSEMPLGRNSPSFFRQQPRGPWQLSATVTGRPALREKEPVQKIRQVGSSLLGGQSLDTSGFCGDGIRMSDEVAMHTCEGPGCRAGSLWYLLVVFKSISPLNTPVLPDGIFNDDDRQYQTGHRNLDNGEGKKSRDQYIPGALSQTPNPSARSNHHKLRGSRQGSRNSRDFEIEVYRNWGVNFAKLRVIWQRRVWCSANGFDPREMQQICSLLCMPNVVTRNSPPSSCPAVPATQRVRERRLKVAPRENQNKAGRTKSVGERKDKRREQGPSEPENMARP